MSPIDFFSKPPRRPSKPFYFSGDIPRIKPGETCVVDISPQMDFRPQRIVLSVQGSEPQKGPYFKKAGGSKRKGRNASLRFFADMLRHQTGKWKPDITIDDVIVGEASQFAFKGSPSRGIPVECFAPQSIIGDVDLDLSKKGHKIRMVFSNRDFSRDAWGRGMIIGRSV